jgi:hypothetical protein
MSQIFQGKISAPEGQGVFQTPLGALPMFSSHQGSTPASSEQKIAFLLPRQMLLTQFQGILFTPVL